MMEVRQLIAPSSSSKAGSLNSGCTAFNLPEGGIINIPGQAPITLTADAAYRPMCDQSTSPIIIANPGVDKMDFELWSTAVSGINGCGACLDAHEGELRKHGVPATQVQAALRIGAVVHAASRIIASETALAN